MKILPIGTVVILNGNENIKRMIIGYYPVHDGKLYDYLTTIFPIGITFEASAYGVFESDITDIYQVGYQNNDFHILKKNMEQLDSEVREKYTQK